MSQPEKPVLGVVETEINPLSGFDFMTRQSRNDWQFIAELRRQYDVRSVNLDVAVEGVDALLVPQASLIAEEHVQHLHDAIWSGIPTLILEDPLPIFHNPILGTSVLVRHNKAPAASHSQQNPKQILTPFGKAWALVSWVIGLCFLITAQVSDSVQRYYRVRWFGRYGMKVPLLSTPALQVSIPC